MNVDYSNLERDLMDGSFRQTLADELTLGFRMLHQEGERLPAASHYASQITEIVHSGAAGVLHPDLAFLLYQEILSAVEESRDRVLAEPVPPPQ